MNVMVFSTSVSNKAEVQKLKPLLDGLLQSGGQWNFDLDDCDHVLRVQDAACGVKPVIGLLKSMGHRCEELGD